MPLCAINSRCQRSQNFCVFIAQLAQQKTQSVFSQICNKMTEGACERNDFAKENIHGDLIVLNVFCVLFDGGNIFIFN